MAALPCALGTWKWANRLMEQSYCYISPFTVKKSKRVYFRSDLEVSGGRHGSGISVTVIGAD